MIVELHTARRRFPAADLGALIEGHGAPRVVVALMLALTRRAVARLFGPRAPDVDDLPEHIRRDIGLTADPPGRRPRDPRF